MLPICFLLLVMFCVNSLSLFSIIEPVCRFLHEACTNRIHATEGQWTYIYATLICGEHFPDGEIKKTFVSVGVIHLMVISGAHLIFIERMWKCLPVFPFKNIVLCLFLVSYALSAGLKPPVLRALFSLLLFRIAKRFKMFWSPYWRVQMSGLLCLVFENSLLYSLSLQLSWIASTGMCRRDISRLKSCFVTYLFILPIISQWGGSHPLGILINWLVAPLAACVLLPLSMLILIIPDLRVFTDYVWTQFICLLDLFKPFMENKGIFWLPVFNSFQIWIYICLIFILCQTHFIYSRQRKR